MRCDAISVALCVCNGARFLEEQLESIRNQRLPPLEVVICDDNSSDKSIRIIEAFQGRAAFPVRIFSNASQMGIRENFSRAISLCKGSVIAICDQDDYWLPDKLEQLARSCTAGAAWVCHDASVVSETLTPLGYTMWERVGFDKAERVQSERGRFFSILLRHFVLPGATIAFRRDLRPAILPIPDTWRYDAWISLILANADGGVFMDKSLQLYRQHGGNAVGGRRRTLFSQVSSAILINRRSYLTEEMARWTALQFRIKESGAAQNHAELARKIAHLQRRLNFPAVRLFRIPFVVMEVARRGYAHYSRNWGSVALDLVIR